MTEDAELLQRLELFLNEQRADLGVIRLLLQKFLMRIVTANPAVAEERLQDLINDTMASLNREPRVPRNESEQRMHELTIMRAEEFFGEMSTVLAEARNITRESGKH